MIIGLKATSQTKQTGREKRGKSVYTNLVSTFCYLSLEGELWQLLHGRRRQRLLRGHPHAAEDDDDHGEDEEHAARHVDEDVGVVVLLLWANCCEQSESQKKKQDVSLKSNIKWDEWTSHRSYK